MLTVLILMTAGIAIGMFVNKLPRLIKTADKLISYAIYLLLFLLGISVGLNKRIIENLDTIGLRALLITLGSVAGSVLVAWVLYRFLFQTEKTKEAGNEK